MAKETLKYTFDLDELYDLEHALRDHQMRITGWSAEHKDRVARLHRAFADDIKRLEKPAREEQILKQAAAILRERGINVWTP